MVIVDDGSRTPPTEIVDPIQEQIHIKLVVQPHGGPAAARNAGAASATGEYLAFTDDDCAPDAGWLSAFAECFSQTPAAAAGGRTVNARDDNIHSTASQLLIEYIYSYYNMDARFATFFTSNNFALPAEAFRTMGGFDTRFRLAAGEDRELCDRWLGLGGRLHYVPTALVSHAHPLTFRGFVRQHFNYGRGAFLFHRIRARRKQDTLRVEPVSFYVNLLRYPWSCQRRGVRLTGLLFLAQVATVAGFCCGQLAGYRTNGDLARIHTDSEHKQLADPF